MSKALMFSQNGPWNEVLALQERELSELAPTQVRLKMRAAAVHPSDFGQIAGSYGKLRELPAVAGREGVAEVLEVGAEVSSVKVGDIVRMPEDDGVWASESVAESANLFALPRDVEPSQLALSFINPPTAWRVLADFVKLKKGDVVITNAGKSAVSQAFIQMAARRELKPIVVVRNKSAEDEAFLKSLGAIEVVDEESGYEKQIEKASLALNQVGGESVLRLIKALSEGGTCVTIGGASKDKPRYPTRELIFNDVILRGFWMDKWYRTHSQLKTRAMWDNLWAKMAEGKLTQTVDATFALEDFAAALERASQRGRNGKVLFVG